jgi:catechol 2,3-dioxygenase-like lactoylglutathione lyase family enzyme
MAALEHVDSVAVWVRDPAKAAEFYTGTLGFRLQEHAPDVGWLTVLPPKGGTALALLVPDPADPDYEAHKGQIGGNTGVGLETGNLKATLEGLRSRGASVPWANLDPSMAGGLHATIEDPDGNILMLFQPRTEAQGKGGIERVSFVNVVVRDFRAAKDYYAASLGLQEGEEMDTLAWAEVRCGDRGAALGLLQPVEETYEEPADYAADLAHLGEATGITFLTSDLDEAISTLRAQGVVFTEPPSALPWGGRTATFRDPDGNRFQVVERTPSAQRWASPGRAKVAAKAKAKPKAAKLKAKPAAKAKPKAKAKGKAKAKPKAKAKGKVKPAKAKPKAKGKAPRRRGR